jgi:hypothetical protein
MKVIKIILRVFLILLLVIILSTVGLGLFIYFSVKDSSNNTPQSVIDNNYSTTQVIHNQMVKSLNASSSDLELALDGEAINELVYAFMQGLEIPHATINGAYAKFTEDNDLYIEIPVKVEFIETNLKLTLAGKEENRNFSLQIKDAKLGNLSAFNWLTNWAINKFVDAETIESTLAKQGIICEVDLSTYTISFTKDNLFSFMKSKLSSIENFDLYSVLIKLALNDEEVLGFNLGTTSALGFNLLMDKIKWDETTYGSIPYPIDLESIESSIKSDMESKEINPENISTVYSYYVNGYSSLDGEDKTIIDNLGYDSTYEGVKPDSKEAIKDFLKDRDPSVTEIAEAIANGSYTLKIPESTFNAVFASTEFVGKTIGFASNDDTSYICFESMYVDITENSLDLRIIVNMGGRRMVIVLDTDAPVSTTYVIDANVNVIGLGEVEIDEDDEIALLSFLESVNTEEYLTISPSNKSLSIDLEQLIAGDANLHILSESLTNKTLSFTDDGYLSITYSN